MTLNSTFRRIKLIKSTIWIDFVCQNKSSECETLSLSRGKCWLRPTDKLFLNFFSTILTIEPSSTIMSDEFLLRSLCPEKRSVFQRLSAIYCLSGSSDSVGVKKMKWQQVQFSHVMMSISKCLFQNDTRNELVFSWKSVF